MISDTFIARLIILRKKLHRIPEASGEESATAELIVQELSETKPDSLLTGIGGDGIAAIYKGKNPDAGINLMIRCELDGLKISEKNEFDHKSTYKNRMHACGHDGHMAIVTGIAKLLQDERPETGTVILLYQPAEETGRGAGQILKDPEFKKLKIDRAVALHNLPGFEENTIYIRRKTFAAASVGLKVKFSGKSSHAAYPGQGINPSAAISKVIGAVSEITKQPNDDGRLQVATITYIQMGEASFGISPGTAEAGITLRAETDQLLNELKTQVTAKLNSIDERFEGEISYSESEPFAASINDEAGVEELKEAVEGIAPVLELEDPFPWSEDFGIFRKKCPITLFGLGAGKNSFPLHSEKYDFNDSLISTGVKIFNALIDYYLNR